MIYEVQIGEVAEVNPKIPETLLRKHSELVSFVPMAGVSEDGVLAFSEEKNLMDVRKGYTYFERGDLLIAKITPCFENGKAVLVNDLPHQVGFGSTEFHVLRPSTDIVPKYLFYFIHSPAFRFIGQRNMTGTAGQKRLPADFLKRYKIPLPSLSEQKRIVAILDKADAIRRKRRQAIQLADELLRSLFLDMFGDPAVNPKKFPVKKIKNLLSSEEAGIRTGPFGSSLKKNEYIASGIPVWGIESVENGRFREQTSLFIDEKKFKQLKNYKVQNGDILISRAGTVGRMCVATPTVENSIIGTNLIRVVLDKTKFLPGVFVDLFVKFPKRISALRVNQKENAYSFLNPNILKDALIPLPPIDLQRMYLAIRQKTYQIIFKNEFDMNTQSSLFCSLSQRAFRGDL